MFLIIPSYTYSQAVKLVLTEHSGDQNEDVKRIVPVSGTGYTIFTPNWFYHVVLEEDGGRQSYMVNPNTGEILAIN